MLYPQLLTAVRNEMAKDRIKIPVKGYVSEPIEVKTEIDREQGFHCYITSDSWTRIDNAVGSLERSRAFVESSHRALKIVENFYENIDEVKREYSIANAARQQARDEEERIRREAREADKPVGAVLAKTIINRMVAAAKQMKENRVRWESVTIKTSTRGERINRDIRVTSSGAGLCLFNLDWSRISKDRAQKYIADSSLACLDAREVDVADARIANFLLGKKA
jgi:hypothetical protein